ncbi:MAG TPA: 30S ribosomal protein S2, partial [Pyrinomonadaceae bacterium]|nr:30S ribosomal protein S2 [Pyrinomonadaceae bacterium]
MASVTMKELLEAGVHFGHQVRRWNPKMKEYIFGERNGIYIIDLQKTQRMFRDAIQFVTSLVGEDRGKTVLFVGTKRQAQDAIREEAVRAGQFYINQRWLGGLLTNFQTVQKSIKRLKDLEAMHEDGRYEKMTKKERIKLDRERESLDKNLSGIKSMTRLPDAVFIIDVRKEEIAVAEANRLGIPVVAVVDTNCSPEGIDYIIPGNDDALRAVRLFASRIADAVLEGQQMLTEGGETQEGAGGEEVGVEEDGRPRRRATSASGDNTSSVTTSRDPGREAENFTDMGAGAQDAETQVSVPGNQGFGKTGQQPDSIGDHPQAGTGAPVRGADGGGSDEGSLPRPDNAQQEKGA